VRETLFFRLVHADCRARRLQELVRAVRAGTHHEGSYFIDVEEFRQVPGSAFAYWASPSLRSTFRSFPRLERAGIAVRQGRGSTNDFRFLRLCWEVNPSSIALSRQATLTGSKWVLFAKGGQFSPFFVDLSLVVNWLDNGAELKQHHMDFQESSSWSKYIASSYRYFEPGLTWPLRAHAFCPQVRPSGSIFSVRGYSILASTDHLCLLLGIGSSKVFDFLFRMLLGREEYREYIVGVLQQLPIPEPGEEARTCIRELSMHMHDARRQVSRVSDETSHSFVLPSLVAVRGQSLRSSIAAAAQQSEQARVQALSRWQEIDRLCEDVYGTTPEDQETIEREWIHRRQQREPIETFNVGAAISTLKMSELAMYWEELTEGKYDWAHVAMRYWPERVTAKCREDKSLALAHGLDEEFFPGLREELRREAERAATSVELQEDEGEAEGDDAGGDEGDEE